MITAPDWPELDPWGRIPAAVAWGGLTRVQLPQGLQAWLQAAANTDYSQAAIVRLALARYLAAEYPPLRPELGGQNAAPEH